MDSTVRSEWHSIRPWSSAPRLRPRLALQVREITSVSATFILSTGDPEPFASLVLTADESDDGEEDEDFLETRKRALISDSLAKGLSVNVNGARWQRVLIRIDDKTDEAVIIIYGLMPGRQYDIDLGLVQGGENNSIRKQVITEDSDHTNVDASQGPETSTSNHIVSPDSSPSSFAPSTSDSLPPALSGSHSHSASNSFTLEDRLQQLQHTLSLLVSEHETLTTSWKSARRDAQKADAALRSEVDILKRASEKHTVAEHRARQKLLALQEAVKRAQTTTKNTEQHVREVEGVLPGLKEKEGENEQLYIRVKEDTDHAKREREKEAEMDGRRMEEMKGEMVSLSGKLERANGKREKLEGTIPELEEQLRELEKAIESAEGEFNSKGWDDEPEPNVSGRAGEIVLDSIPIHHHLPVQRQHRHQNQHPPGTIGRPSPPAPIQRPSPTGTTSVQQQPWPTRQSHGVNHRPNFTSPQLSHRQPLPKSPTQAQILQNSYAHLTISDSSPQLSTQTSTLSSRAPPFEPSRCSQRF